jgi:hypothetical protein
MMNATLARTADLPAAPRPQTRGRLRRLGSRLSTLAYDAALRLPSSQRDLSPEYYRFPWF